MELQEALWDFVCLTLTFPSFFSEECILGVNFVMTTDEGSGISTPKLVTTALVLLILLLGMGTFLILSARLKLPRSKAGGYVKLDTMEGFTPQSNTSSFREYSAKIADFEDNDEEYDDEEDIVYMTKDGSMYRKGKYGLLDDDDDELEYDDESYSFRWKPWVFVVLKDF